MTKQGITKRVTTLLAATAFLGLGSLAFASDASANSYGGHGYYGGRGYHGSFCRWGHGHGWRFHGHYRHRYCGFYRHGWHGRWFYGRPFYRHGHYRWG